MKADVRKGSNGVRAALMRQYALSCTRLVRVATPPDLS